MVPLKDKLRACVARLGESPRAAIVDDEVNLDDERSLADWLALREVLQADPRAFDALERFLDAEGHSSDEPPSLDLWEKIKNELTFPDTEEIRSAIAEYENQEQVVSMVAAFLKDVGFQATCFDSKPDIKEVQEADLFLIDYQLLPEETVGQRAQQLFAEIMHFCGESDRVPPMVILMSKMLDAENVQTWEDAGIQSGYYRSNYAFLSKNEFKRDQAVLSFSLISLLQHKPVSDAYYRQLKSVSTEAAAVAERLVKDLFQVTPSEAKVFQRRLEREGMSLADVCLDMFTDHFAERLRQSGIVHERMVALEKAVSSSSLMAPPASQRNVLHRMHARLLHRVCGENEPCEPHFGDIYLAGDNLYLLIMSQECDIAPRGDGPPKKDHVLTVEGTVQPRMPTKGTSESIIAKPLLNEQNDSLSWLHWDTGRPRVVLYDELASERFKKAYKLRTDHAEEIRHLFVSQLTRVGLDLIPEFVQSHTCRLFSERLGQLLDGEILMYEIGQFSGPQIAFSPDCSTLYFGLGQYPFLPHELILELSQFHPRRQFVGKLRQQNVVIYIEKSSGVLLLCKTKTGSPSKETLEYLEKKEYCKWK